MEQQAGLPAGDDQGERTPRQRAWNGWLRSIVLPLAILAFILGGLWYWSNRGGAGIADDPRHGIVDLPAAKNPTGKRPAAESGRAAPDFLLQKAGGGELRLSDLQGHPVLLNFWASWCPPCRQEMPELADAYDKYRARGLVIVGVNLQEADSKVAAFAAEYDIQFPLVIDRDGELANVYRLGGPINGIPTSYFIDASGVLRDLYYGPMKQGDIDKRVAEILPEATG